MSPSIMGRFYETPYIYAKNYFQNYTSSVGPAAPNGVLNDVIASDGDSDFFARRACGSLYNFQDNNQAWFVSGAQQSGFVQDFPLAPEKLYPLGASIPIQLLIQSNTYPAQYTLTFAGGTTAYVGVCPVMFQGVKRWKGAPNNNPGYRFYEKEYNYPVQFTQNWTYLQAPYTSFIVAPFRSFYQTVLDYDFELWGIEVSADFNNYTDATYSGYMLRLYDANGYALMKDFVHYRQLSYNSGYSGNGGSPGNTLQYTPNCFPVPPVVFPKGSNIQFDVLSLLDTTAASSIVQYVNFRGVRRIPC
jgi:hypothetical protein